MSDGPGVSRGMKLHSIEFRGRLRAGARAARAVATRVGPGLAFLSLVGLWAAAYLVWALQYVVEFPGHEGDGPFQLFNPLRRIDAGQTGGVDFQYFHGLALPYLHYPLYRLGGGDLYAAEMARHVVALAVYLGTTLAACFAIARRITPALGLTALALVVGDQVNLYGVVTAGNASMGVRSATPILVLAALLAGFRPRVEAVVVGVLAGAGILFGVEHGVATLAMVGVVWAARRWWSLPGASFGWAASVAAVTLVTLATGLVAIGGRAGAVGSLTFSFAEVPADQFWYFGAPPNPFLHRWADVFTDRQLWLRALGPFAILGVIAVRTGRARVADRPAAAAALGLIGYGSFATASYFGYSSTHYLEPLTRTAIVAALVLAWRAWLVLEEQGGAAEPLRRNLCGAVAAATALALVVGPTPQTFSSVGDIPGTAKRLSAQVAAIRGGRCVTVPKLQREYDTLIHAVDADRAARGVTRSPVLWSTFAGRLEAHYGVFHPYCDYAIHALGTKRRTEYLDAFRRTRPDYVVTCRPTEFGTEEWLRNGTWEWYEELLFNYEPLARGNCFVAWGRKPGGWNTPDPGAGRVSFTPDRPDGFNVPAPPGCPADAPRVVEVEYELRNPAAGVPVVSGLPRHLLGPLNCRNWTPVSLPPYRTNFAFAVFPKAGETPAFFAKTFSLVGGGVKITRVHVRPLAATPGQVAALTE